MKGILTLLFFITLCTCTISLAADREDNKEQQTVIIVQGTVPEVQAIKEVETSNGYLIVESASPKFIEQSATFEIPARRSVDKALDLKGKEDVPREVNK